MIYTSLLASYIRKSGCSVLRVCICPPGPPYRSNPCAQILIPLYFQASSLALNCVLDILPPFLKIKQACGNTYGVRMCSVHIHLMTFSFFSHTSNLHSFHCLTRYGIEIRDESRSLHRYDLHQWSLAVGHRSRARLHVQSSLQPSVAQLVPLRSDHRSVGCPQLERRCLYFLVNNNRLRSLSSSPNR